MSIYEDLIPKPKRRAKYTNESVDTRLIEQERNIIRLSQVVNSFSNVKWQCVKCKYIWNTSPNKILNKNCTGCPKCKRHASITNEIVDTKLVINSRHIIRLGQVTTTHSKIRWQCSNCNYVWNASPNNVLDKGSGCPQCAPTVIGKTKSVKYTNQVSDILNKKQLSLISEYTKIIDYHTVCCNVCEHQWLVRLTNIIHHNSGCPRCNKVGRICESYFTSHPEKRNIPGQLYLVSGEVNGHKFIKVGITERTVNERYISDINKYNIQEISSLDTTLYLAFMAEQEILHKYVKYLEPPCDNFDGKTECLQYDDIIINNIVSSYF